MSRARFIVGDVRDVLATIADASVDLVVTSPPFLALRSYLPADHPDKGREIGSEPTPAEFLRTLLDLTGELRRVLAPHGSICVELGDTYSGSGGGDYGTRDGQFKFKQQRDPRWSYADAQWLAALIDAEGSIHVGIDNRDKSPRYSPAVAVGMNGDTMLRKAAAITGCGEVVASGDGFKWSAFSQQARYVLLNVWPYLMVKQEQAKAAIELARLNGEGKRGPYNPITAEQLAERELIRRFIMNLNEKGGNKGRYPNDWVPPTPPSPRHTNGTWGTGWPLPKSLAGIPTLYAWSLAYGRNLLDPTQTVAPWRIRNVLVWARPNPPVGALGDKFRPAVSYITVACVSDRRWFDLDAVRTAGSDNTHARTAKGVASRKSTGKTADDERRGGNFSTLDTLHDTAGAPPLDWHSDCDPGTHDGDRLWVMPTQPYAGAHYATFPSELPARLVKAMCPMQVCTVCHEPRRRIVGDTAEYEAVKTKWSTADFGLRNAKPGDTGVPAELRSGGRGGLTAQRDTLGWSDCGHDNWRNGLTLDPFAGSGATLAAATGAGRDALGIDLDARNLHLARERVGMFLETEVVP